jgi:ribonucleoside-diphosphate reductase alpha chain
LLTRPEDVDPEAMAQSAPVEQPVHNGRDGHEASDGPDALPLPAIPAPEGAHTTTELIESHQGRTADAPLCLTCGTKMRPAGSCYVCEGCGSTSGCS